MTTILEKSLGAAAKGGTRNLAGVYDYAEQVDTRGFVFMDTPGYDPVSATGQVAGRGQHPVLHDGAGLGLWLQAHALDQARDQFRHLPPHDRRHGHQLRRRSRRRHDRRQGSRDLRPHPGGGLGRPFEIPRRWVMAMLNSSPGRSARRCERAVVSILRRPFAASRQSGEPNLIAAVSLGAVKRGIGRRHEHCDVAAIAG